MIESRKYKSTHPWITFELDMKKGHPRLWILLGRVMEGCKQLRNARISPELAEKMIFESRAGGVYGTTVMEGNAISYDKVNEINRIKRIAIKKEIEGKSSEKVSKDGVEGNRRFTLNVLRLFIFLTEKSEELGMDWDLDLKGIAGLHRVLYSGIAVRADTIPGEIRKRGIRIGGYRGVPCEECIYLMKRLTNGLADVKKEFPAGDEIVSGMVRAFLAHKYIAWIQPFEMGNGITARFVELQIMLSAGVPAVVAFCQSAYYNRTYREYSDHLYVERKGSENVMVFIEYGLRGFLEELNRLIEEVNTFQEGAVWKSCLDSILEEKKSRIARRQQNLIFDIIESRGSVPARDVRYISPRTTEAYAGKSDKTVTRDIQCLIDYGLLTKQQKVLEARKEMIRPFKRRKSREKNEF